MLDAARSFLETEETSLKEVIFCLWSKDDLDLFARTLDALMPPGK